MKVLKNYKSSNQFFLKFLFLFTIFLVVVLTNSAYAQITRQEAVRVLIDEVITGDSYEDQLMAFGPQNILSSGNTVSPFILGKQPYPGTSRTLDRATWFFWINDEPNDLFMHSTRFVYIDANHTNPTIGDGIIIDQAGWWPKINGTNYYRYWSLIGKAIARAF